jgi:hypothetical protein
VREGRGTSKLQVRNEKEQSASGEGKKGTIKLQVRKEKGQSSFR